MRGGKKQTKVLVEVDRRPPTWIKKRFRLLTLNARISQKLKKLGNLLFFRELNFLDTLGTVLATMIHGKKAQMLSRN